MRNKLFELYRPKQLAEFLEFNKANPTESFVYVLQHPPTQGKFNLLKWDRQETRYYPLSFNLFEKGEDE